MSLVIKSVFLFLCVLVSSCATMNPNFENPTVKVANLRLLPAQGFSQPIEVTLLISNPNAKDLSLRGISYTVGFEGFELLSGVQNQLPTLTAYQETPVTVTVSANVIQIVQFISHLNNKGLSDSVKYNFDAKLDFHSFLPALRVRESGVLPLKK